jgi:glycosyltransferase involved in cell wall biosynthesis
MGKANLRVLILFSGLMTPSSYGLNRPIGWTGVATRFFEVLKKGRSHGIDYVVVFEKRFFLQATKQFPSISVILKNYHTYLVDLMPITANDLNGHRIRRFLEIALFGPIQRYVQILSSSIAMSRIAAKEKVDLVLSTSEADWLSLEAYVAAKLSRKPWTAIWQPFEEFLEPTAGFSPLSPLNILSFIGSKAMVRKNSKRNRIMQAIATLTELKLAERTLTLTVSQSVVEQVASLNPRARFHIISPGNGIDLSKYQVGSKDRKYDAIFFARLVPEKGLYDLTEIWKFVLLSLPKAKLVVAGIPDNPSFIDHFSDLVQENQLSENITFVGELGKNELILLIKSSGITLYPSLLDSFAIVVLESLACGVPVVAYDIPAIRENYGKCPAVFRCAVKDVKCMAERTISLLKNENLRTTFSENAREYSSKYDWEHVVESEKEAYLKVIDRFN